MNTSTPYLFLHKDFSKEYTFLLYGKSVSYIQFIQHIQSLHSGSICPKIANYPLQLKLKSTSLIILRGEKITIIFHPVSIFNSYYVGE